MAYTNIESKGNDIYEFGRDKTGKSYTQKTTYKPYFFYEDDAGRYTALTGERCSICVVNTHKDIALLKTRYKKTFEDDVSFVQRYIIDTYHDKQIEEVPIRKMYLDIEVDDSEGFTAIDEKRMKITAITLHDSFTHTYYTLVLDRKPIEFTPEHRVRSFSQEKDLLLFFAKVVQKIDPDVMTAWNAPFDIPYIFSRMEKNGLDIGSLSRLQRSFITPNGTIRIKGRAVIDLLAAYKKLTFAGLSSYALEFVARHELGEGKEKYQGLLSDTDDEKFIKYNLRDVELLVMLDEKMKIIEFYDTLRRLAKVNLQDTMSSMRLIDSIVLCKAKKENVILPSTDSNAKKHQIKGGHVKEPPKGLHQNVCAFDFSGLYPSIICQCNLSYECFTDKSDDVINVHNEFFFKKDRQGFATSILQGLKEERKRYKALEKATSDPVEKRTYHLMQYAIKVLMNAYFGVSTNEFFRLYRWQIGESITAIGRKLAERAEGFILEKGHESVVVDTDSCFFKADTADIVEAIQEGKKLNAEINQLWDAFFESYNTAPNKYITMQFEKMYSNLLTIGVKKRYAGLVIWKDGEFIEPKLDVKGMSTVRSDYPLKAQTFLKNILLMILQGKTRQECLEFIKVFKEEFKKASVEEIGFPTSVRTEYKNHPIQLRACLNAKEWLKIPFNNGDKIRYYFLKKTPKNVPFDDVCRFTDSIPDGFQIDWERTFTRIIDGPLEPVFQAIGWNLHKTLDDY